MERTETNNRYGRSPPADPTPQAGVGDGQTEESAQPQMSGEPVISVVHTDDTTDPDTLVVHISGVGLEFIRDGLLTEVGPTDWANSEIQKAVADAGFTLDSYDDIQFTLPDADELIDVRLSCSVSPKTASSTSES